jgi:hypothetical protein
MPLKHLIETNVGNLGTSELTKLLPNRVLLKPFHLDDIARQVLDVIVATDIVLPEVRGG